MCRYTEINLIEYFIIHYIIIKRKTVKMRIIGVSGKAGVGKDYLTINYLVPMITRGRTYCVVSFADHFKIDSIVKDGLDRNKVYGSKDRITRQFLQQRGTEEGRMKYGENIWVNILNELIIQYEKRGIEFVFITDCRFENEVKFIHDNNGVVIKIVAGDRNKEAMIGKEMEQRHQSEDVNGLKFDYMIDNSNGQKDLTETLEDITTSIFNRFKYKILYCANAHSSFKTSEKDCRVIYISDKYESIEKTTFNVVEYVPTLESFMYLLKNKYPYEKLINISKEVHPKYEDIHEDQ
jgi:hypothetical protein